MKVLERQTQNEVERVGVAQSLHEISRGPHHFLFRNQRAFFLEVGTFESLGGNVENLDIEPWLDNEASG